MKIDFGKDSVEFGGGTTTYTYTNDWPMVGFYTIARNTGSRGRGWHSINDKSGEGYMMIVNADRDAGEFYRTTVRGLCENTDFYYSALIANISTPDLSLVCGGPVLPVGVTMEIRDTMGNVLQTISTDTIPTTYTTPEWHQVEMHFNTGNNTDVVLVLINNGAGGCGNNLVIDDY